MVTLHVGVVVEKQPGVAAGENANGPAGSSPPGLCVCGVSHGIQAGAGVAGHQHTFRGRPGLRGFLK
jgi:hypothetical protein